MDERRKVTYRLYPKPRQAAQLEHHRRLHQQLYNALLEQRIWAHRAQRKSLRYEDQCREITALRRECPEYAEIGCHALQVTAKRVAWAFQNFYRGVRQGKKKAGFPRFKSMRRYPGFGYKDHGDGWRVHSQPNGKHGWLRLTGVGRVRIRALHSSGKIFDTKSSSQS